MARSKEKISFITKESRRRATFNGRKNSLLRKVSELSTLCGVLACAIILSPDTPQPCVWPSLSGVQEVIEEYHRMDENDQAKKHMNQETFLKKRITKLNQQLKKKQVQNQEKAINLLMLESLLEGNERLESMPVEDLKELGKLIDQNLEKINRRLKAIKDMDSIQEGTAPVQEQDCNQFQWYLDLIKHPMENFGLHYNDVI